MAVKLASLIPILEAGKCHLSSINRSVSRYHSCTTIERSYTGSKSLQLLFSLLNLVGVTLALSLPALESYILALLLKVTNGVKRW